MTTSYYAGEGGHWLLAGLGRDKNRGRMSITCMSVSYSIVFVLLHPFISNVSNVYNVSNVSNV